ncbi:hypothetical protein BLA39750_00984 [Burkholderia lata]|uniref:Uncharacterized protein n=1 Tax=Burkholderia lata (strain ATCC 17760 / DSM 23089 / LMG 22485 / NCIMB 9086 / R18194 / 383) TaxID=482957 RepID=A0A6P2V2T2_BURL3|nr:hypothetical protein BLA39750_00984 [Burkholderia lata]
MWPVKYLGQDPQRMLAPRRHLFCGLQNHWVRPNEVVANPSVKVRMGVPWIVLAIGRYDDISLTLTALIKLQPVFRELIICSELTFQLAVNFKTADNILLNGLPHTPANHEYLPA